MTQPWNMANVRSRQLPRKYKPVGPVGSPMAVLRYEASHDAPKSCPRMGPLNDDVESCLGCGYHICSCHDFVTWSDGSRHRCTCSGRGEQVYALDTDCRGHEHVEHPERFPDKFCATHKQWKNGGACDECSGRWRYPLQPSGLNSVSTEPPTPSLTDMQADIDRLVTQLAEQAQRYEPNGLSKLMQDNSLVFGPPSWGFTK